MALVSVTDTMRTLEELRQQVYFYVNEEYDGDTFPLADVDRAINAGLSFVSRQTMPRKTQITTTSEIGEPRIEIPDGLMSRGRVLVDLVYFDGNELEELDLELVDSTTVDGTPTGFAIDGDDLILSPMPSTEDTIDVYLRLEFAPLVDDDDTADIGDLATEAAIMYACYMLKVKDEELEMASYFKQAWMDAMSTASEVPAGLYRYAEGRTSNGPM